MNLSMGFVLMVAAVLVACANGAPSFHDFLDDDNLEADQELLGEFGNTQVCKKIFLKAESFSIYVEE